MIGQGNQIKTIGRNTLIHCQSSLEDKEREKGEKKMGDRQGEEVPMKKEAESLRKNRLRLYSHKPRNS